MLHTAKLNQIFQIQLIKSPNIHLEVQFWLHWIAQSQPALLCNVNQALRMVSSTSPSMLTNTCASKFATTPLYVLQSILLSRLFRILPITSIVHSLSAGLCTPMPAFKMLSCTLTSMLSILHNDTLRVRLAIYFQVHPQDARPYKWSRLNVFIHTCEYLICKLQVQQMPDTVEPKAYTMRRPLFAGARVVRTLWHVVEG